MAAAVANHFHGRAVSIDSAQRNSRISRLSDTFEECRQRASQLRKLPEMTAIFDVLDNPCSRNKFNERSELSKVEQRNPAEMFDTMSKTGEAIKNTSPCVNRTSLSLTSKSTCTKSCDPTPTASRTPLSTPFSSSKEFAVVTNNTESRNCCDANMHVLHRNAQLPNGDTALKTKSTTAAQSRSIEEETSDSIANIRIVRVESLSTSCNLTRESVMRPTVIQSMPAAHGDRDDRHLINSSTNEEMPFVVNRQQTLLVPCPYNNMRAVYGMPPMYIPNWLEQRQSVRSQKFDIPKLFRPQTTLINRRNPPGTYPSLNANSYTETDMYGTLPQEPHLKIESCRSVFASSYDVQRYRADHVFPPAKRPRYEVAFEESVRLQVELSKRLRYSQTVLHHV